MPFTSTAADIVQTHSLPIRQRCFHALLFRQYRLFDLPFSARVYQLNLQVCVNGVTAERKKEKQ